METNDKTSTIENSNPWKGLNFYKEGEILYGRDDEIQSLALYVFNNIQTVLYGKSGIGKSSVINAGIFPLARKEGLFPIPIRLKHDQDTSYIEQIRTAFIESGIGIKEILPAIDEHRESLWEYLHRHTFFEKESKEAVRPLIVLDQFEEFFTLQHDENKKKAFFSELADLLNEVTPQYIINANNNNEAKSNKGKRSKVEDSGFVLDLGLSGADDSVEYITDSLFNIVFTIREDFLSYLERYTKFIPVMKSNRYALLPLNEEQAKDIIMKPVPGLVDIDVAKLIIQKVTGRTDFSLGNAPEIDVDAAVLSLYLSRLYIKKGDDDATISRELVDESSKDIIKDFYEKSVSDLPETDVEKIEDQLLTHDGRRNNVSRNDLLKEGVSEDSLFTLVEKRKLLRQFSYQDDMRVEYMHDILCPIVNERIEKREEAKRKAEEQRLQEEQHRKFLAEEQRKREEIERKNREEQNRLREEAIRIREKNRRRITAIILVVFFIGIVFSSWYVLTRLPYSEYYGNYTLINGWPNGLGKEIKGKETKERLMVHYRLTRKGYLPSKYGGKPFTRVDVLDANDNITTNKFIETPIVGLLASELSDEKAKEFANLQKETAYWIFTPSNINDVAKCSAYGMDNNNLYSVQYYRDFTFVSDDENKYVQWAIFYDSNGKQMMVTDNGVDRLRQTIKNGFVTGCLFFTEVGTPQKNAYGAYGYQYEVNDTTYLIKKQYCVDKFGSKIDSTVITFMEYRYGRVKKSSLYEIKYPEIGMIIQSYDDFTDTLLFNSNGTIGYGSFHINGNTFSKIVFEYDDKSRPLLQCKFINNELFESKKFVYSTDNKLNEIIILENGQSYSERYSYPDNNTVEMSFWKNEEKFSWWKPNEFKDTIFFHKSIKNRVSDSTFIIETTEYQDDKQNLIPNGQGYSKYSILKDIYTKNIRLEYFYDADQEICKSEWFEYDEYGNRTARAVAGIDGVPVRCPNWDWNGLCYYKMSFLKNFGNNVYIATQGINEFEEASYVCEGDLLFDLTELPLDRMEYDEEVDGLRTRCFGLFLAQNTRKQITNVKKVPFLHVLSKNGSIYNAHCISTNGIDSLRLMDGNILCHVGNWKLFDSEELLEKEWGKLLIYGGDIEIYRIDNDSYTKQPFHIDAGMMGGEYHFMPLTNIELQRITKNN